MLSRPKRDHADLFKILQLRYKWFLLYTLYNPALAGATLTFCILCMVMLLC